MFDANEEVYEEDEAPPFYSDDKLHYVMWTYREDVGFPTWICITHNVPYYLDCINSRPQSS